MKVGTVRKGILGLLALGCTSLATLTSAQTINLAERRAWTPRDSIALREFVTETPGFERRMRLRLPQTIVSSPNGKYFYFITRRGWLESDENIYELQVFSTEEIRRSLSTLATDNALPTPFRKAVFRSNSSQDLKMSARWDTDGTSVLFLGPSNDNSLQVFRLDVPSGRVVKMTSHTDEITWFEYVRGTLLFGDKVKPAPRSYGYPMEMVVHDSFGAGRVLSAYRAAERLAKRTTFVSFRGGVEKPISGDFLSGAWIAPDGLKAVFVSWGTDSQYVLADLVTARIVPLIKLGRSRTEPGALWSADSKRVILINAAVLPDKGETPQSSSEAGYVVDYQIGDKDWQTVAPVDLPDKSSLGEIGWLNSRNELLISRRAKDRPVSATVYQLKENKWFASPGAALVHLPGPPNVGFSIFIRESADEPPVALAKNDQSEIALTEADHALNGVWRTPVESFSWRDPDGKTVTGGLILPRDLSKHKPVPLVIQAYHYDPSLFQPDGPHPGTSDAAQSLVASGMVVLQVETKDIGLNTPLEGPNFVARIDAAIEALTKKGIIDPHRVGLTGFSRGGYQTYYAITHPGKFRLSAVICADSFTGDYSSELRYMALDGSEDESIYGGSFWKKRDKWLEHETSFNVDRIATPALFTENANGMQPRDVVGSAQSLGTIGAFLWNKKPLEYIYFPTGEHQLVRPRERLALLELVVDWMGFWLQGKVPAGAERATRWAKLRSQQEAVNVELAAKGEKVNPLPPLVPALKR